MPRFDTANKYMKFLKTFKKMFKALNTHYISKGAENNVNHRKNAEKASAKMVKIFCEAYDIAKENGYYHIHHVLVPNNNNNNVTITWENATNVIPTTTSGRNFIPMERVG